MRNHISLIPVQGIKEIWRNKSLRQVFRFAFEILWWYKNSVKFPTKYHCDGKASAQHFGAYGMVLMTDGQAPCESGRADIIV